MDTPIKKLSTVSMVHAANSALAASISRKEKSEEPLTMSEPEPRPPSLHLAQLE